MKQLNKLLNPNEMKLYTYLCQLEVDLKGPFGTFNIKDPRFNNFLEQEGLLLGGITEKNEYKIGKYKYFLLSNLQKTDKFKDIADNNHAFLHLKHKSNSIAHDMWYKQINKTLILTTQNKVIFPQKES